MSTIFTSASKGRHDGVDAALARGEVAGDVADEVELRPLAVDVDAHARGEHADGRRDGEDGGHGEMRPTALMLSLTPCGIWGSSL